MDLGTLFTDLDITLDFRVIIFLMSVGFCIKHVPSLEKISNQIIPGVIICLSLLVNLFQIPVVDATHIIDSIISGVITAAVAIGLHQQGKTIFNFIDLDKIGKK